MRGGDRGSGRALPCERRGQDEGGETGGETGAERGGNGGRIHSVPYVRECRDVAYRGTRCTAPLNVRIISRAAPVPKISSVPVPVAPAVRSAVHSFLTDPR